MPAAKIDADPTDPGLRLREQLCQRHLLAGWSLLLLFLSLGIVLETMHGFKIAWYLSVDHETRRSMWTLAHTHGTLLGLIQLAFAFTLSRQRIARPRGWTWASGCLLGAGLLMPIGFLLGGWFHYSGDPGLGILLVPPGGFLLLVGVLLIVATLSIKTPGQKSTP